MAIQYVPQWEYELNYWKLAYLRGFIYSVDIVYESPEFVQNDPVQFPRKYSGVQAEISGFITSWISFGNRNAIIKTAEQLDQEFCGNPYQWAMRGEYSKGSACKRICMFLRWMVRRNSPVDMGLWMKLDPKCLIIPLDTHVHRIAVKWWFTSRKHADMKAAVEITQFFKLMFPDDPVKGDFLLFGYGIEHKNER